VSYEQYRANKIETGLIYQDFITDLLHQTIGIAVNQYASQLYQYQIGEGRSGIEIKHDELYVRTGNLWIEVAEKARPRSGDYVPSGIDRDNKSWLYVIGDYDTVFGFPIIFLKSLKATGRYNVQENKTKTSMGFLFRDKDARKYAAFILSPKAEKKIVKAVQDLQELGRLLHQTVRAIPGQRTLFDDVGVPPQP
jgi:hypothetical protein